MFKNKIKMKPKLSSILYFKILLLLVFNSSALTSYYDETNPLDASKSSSDLNKEFWEIMYQNSMLNTRTKYNVLNDEKVCFTCPIDRNIFTSLYHDALDSGAANAQQQHQAPPRVTISWATQLNENRIIFFCKNNTRRATNPLYISSDESSIENGMSSTQMEFSCENNRLCLHNVRNSYPKNYQCYVKSYVLNVRMDVIVQLTHVLLYFTGDSVKFDYQKEVQVHENQVFTVKCEVPESNPVSVVSAYIDNRELRLTGLEKKTLENRMTINTYSFDVNATRSMNGKKVKCDAQMKDIPPELSNTMDLRSHLFKDYTISVYYLPTCVYKERIYRTGINRSIIIECPINGSNPDVTYYKMIPPSTRTKFELIDNNLDTLRRVGRYRINPTSAADFGLYECIPRSLAGTAKCDIIVELGSTPNPPEQCSVQFAKVNNKTFAQFSCRPGHNQGGSSSFLSIYEIVDKQLKLSGRVNIDESKLDKEVPYITPADEDKYYEFLIMQENNFGNSSSIILTLGTPRDPKQMVTFDFKNIYMIAGIVAGILFLFCLCACCCCNDICSSSKSDNAFCKCCTGNENQDDDVSTYKKPPMDPDALGPAPNSRSFAHYSSELNSTLKLGAYGSNLNSNYEYYDNTSTGLLQNEALYGQIKNKKGNLLSYENQDDSYNHNYEEEDNEDHYMNDHEEKMIKQQEEDNFSSNNDNPDDSMESSDAKSPDDDRQGFIQTINKNPNSMFNNNVSVSIGSGVESIKKHTYNLTTNAELFGRVPSSQKQNTVKFSNNNTYTTIDRKNNNKLIKTNNGLVYTPISNEKSKEETEPEHYEYDNCDEKQMSNYGSMKRGTHQNNSFQAELSLKLKSINSKEEAKSPDSDIYSKNLKVPNGQQSKLLPSASYTQSEPLSNSTATTSVSSASSCASNSDLIIKKETNTNTNNIYGTMKRTGNNLDTKNYSLLKTTINVNNSSSQNLNEPSSINNNGTLNRNLKPINLINSNKPPILKPKPRNNVYQSTQLKKHLNSTSESLHNQSVEPLLNQTSNTTKEFSFHTSPSTSVTDVSSTNCTPQHYNSNLIEEIGQANSILNKASNTMTRSRSNSLTKNSRSVTTTFGPKTTTQVNSSSIYSTIKLNCNNNNNINTANPPMKTFSSPNDQSANNTLNRNKAKKLASIDDEISAIQQQNGNFSGVRTMERRHVKNSEC